MVFTDIHQQTNLEQLYKYILHRIYDFEFLEKAQANQKTAIFLPSGFDSLNLIDKLCKGTPLEGKVFENVIQRPHIAGGLSSKVKPEIVTDDWQATLKTCHDLKALSGTNGVLHFDKNQTLTLQAATGAASGTAIPTPKAAKQNAGEEKSSMAKGFFQGLLHKGRSAAPGDAKKVLPAKKPLAQTNGQPGSQSSGALEPQAT